MVLDDSAGQLVELGEAIDSTSGKLKEMSLAFGRLSKSSTEWTIISRFLSGSGLWRLQNRIRGIGNIMFILEERQKKQIESQNEFFDIVSKNTRVVDGLNSVLGALNTNVHSANKNRLKSLKTWKSYNMLYGEEIGYVKLKEQYEMQLERAEAARFRLRKTGFKERLEGYKDEKKVLMEVVKNRMSSLGVPTAPGIPTRAEKEQAALTIPGIGEIKGVRSGGWGPPPALRPVGPGIGLRSATSVGLDQKQMRDLARYFEIKKLQENMKKAGVFGAKTYEALVNQKKGLKEQINQQDKQLTLIGEFATNQKNIAKQEKNVANARADKAIAANDADEATAANARRDAEVELVKLRQSMDEMKEQFNDEGLKTYDLEDQKKAIQESLAANTKAQKETAGDISDMENALNKLPVFKQIAFVKNWFKRVKGMEKFKDFMKDAWKGFKGLLKVLGILMLVGVLVAIAHRFGIIDQIKNFFTQTIPKKWKEFSDFFTQGKGFLTYIIEGVTDIYTAFSNLISGKGDNTIWENLIMILKGFGKLLIGLIGPVIGIFAILISALWDGLMGWLGRLKNDLTENTGKFWKRLFKGIGAVLFTLSALGLVIAMSSSTPWGVGAGLAALGTVGGASMMWISGQMASGGITGKSGMFLVGEKGPELVSLPSGSRVYSNTESRNMSGVTNNITVQIQGRVGASDTEIRDIAQKVGTLVSREINRTTNSSVRYR